MIKYSSCTNHLRFSLRCHHNKILSKDLQLKSRIKTERSNIILQRAGKLLLQEQIHIIPIVRDRLKNSIKQLKGKILENLNLSMILDGKSLQENKRSVRVSHGSILHFSYN